MIQIPPTLPFGLQIVMQSNEAAAVSAAPLSDQVSPPSAGISGEIASGESDLTEAAVGAQTAPPAASSATTESAAQPAPATASTTTIQTPVTSSVSAPAAVSVVSAVPVPAAAAAPVTAAAAPAASESAAPVPAAAAVAGGTFAQEAAMPSPQVAPLNHLPSDAVHLTQTLVGASSRVVQGAKASLARPIMSGSMSTSQGKVQLLGQWKMQETDTVSSAFEYTSDHAVPVAWPPSAAQTVWLAVSGFFRIALTEPAGSGSMTVPEKESVLFVGGDVPVDAPSAPAGLAVIGLRGSGKNRYGDFQLRGWYAPSDTSLKMLRIYTTNKPTKRAPTPHKNKTPAKRRGEAASVLPRTQRRRSAPKRLAEVGFTGEMTAELRACYNMLESMMKAKAAMFFNDPVDPVALKLPDYFDIVKQPMDYSTVKDKIKLGKYTDPQEFERDMLLVYSNAILYNPVGDPVRAAAEKEREVFRSKMQDMQQQWAEKARKAKAALEAKAKKRERSFDETEDMGVFGDAKKARGQLSLPGSMAFQAPPQGGAFGQHAGAAATAGNAQHSHPLASVMAAASSSGMDPSSMAAMMQVFQAMNGGGVDPSVLMQALQAQNGMRGATQTGPAPTTSQSMHASQSSLQAAGGAAPLTLREKQQLASDVSRLTDAQMDQIVRIVRERMHIPADQTDIELDVDNMDTGTLRALQQYVAACLGRSTPADKKKPVKRKPRAAPAAKPKPVKRKPKESYGASIPPPRAASAAPPASLPNMSNSLSSLQSQLGIGSAPTLPSGQPSGLGGGLAAAMDDALDVPVSSAAAPSTVPSGSAPAAVAEPDEAEDFNFDVSGWEDTTTEAAAAAGSGSVGAKDASKLTAALHGSTAAAGGFEDDWGM